MELIAFYIIQILYLYTYLIVFYILLGWIKEVRESSFYRWLSILVYPFFKVFRGILVFNGLDFTPMVGILIIQMILNFALARI
jgi:uncharacterized protein YggT (Ycf19 family)